MAEFSIHPVCADLIDHPNRYMVCSRAEHVPQQLKFGLVVLLRVRRHCIRHARGVCQGFIGDSPCRRTFPPSRGGRRRRARARAGPHTCLILNETPMSSTSHPPPRDGRAGIFWAVRRVLFKLGIMPIFDAPGYARHILAFMPNCARAMRKCRKSGMFCTGGGARGWRASGCSKQLFEVDEGDCSIRLQRMCERD
eukprot:COSAG02_NODE_5268_length_4484_cov_1.709920_1_plen_195_part_00